MMIVIILVYQQMLTAIGKSTKFILRDDVGVDGRNDGERFPTHPGAPGARDLPARNISARTKSTQAGALHDRFHVNYIEECAAEFVERVLHGF